MNILGIGTGIVECARIARMIERHGDRFLRKVFTTRELRECNARKRATEHFAARWAAKEAIFKALGLSWRGPIAWTDLELRQEHTERPVVHVGGGGKEHLQRLRVADILVSFTSTRQFACGYALVLARPKPNLTSPVPDEDVPF